MTGAQLNLDDQGKSLLQERDVTRHAEMVRAQSDTQAAAVIAMKYPRNETSARKGLEDATKRLAFAETAYYSYPRGGKEIFGPSINLAREFARLWGHVHYGFRIVYDTEDERTIEGYAWDRQTNTQSLSQVSFRKLIQRKDKATQITRWITPDERDLRELTERHAAVQMRNCILRLAPRDVIDEMVKNARGVVAKGINKKDIKKIRVETVEAFEQIGVSSEKLDTYCNESFGHGVDKVLAEEVADLRGVWNAIKENQTKRDEYFGKTKEPPKLDVTPEITVKDIESSAQPTPEEKAAIENAEKAVKEEAEPKKETETPKEYTKGDYSEYLSLLEYANTKKYLPAKSYAHIVNGATVFGADFTKKVNHIQDELRKLGFDIEVLRQEMHDAETK